MATSGALLMDGEKAEALIHGHTPATTAPITQVFRSLLIASPEVDRIYVLGVLPGGQGQFGERQVGPACAELMTNLPSFTTLSR